MSEIWIPLTIAAGVFGVIAWCRRSQRPEPAVEFADPREEQLARTVARVVGCTPTQAVPAVREELSIAPGQSDETLVKRAVYHYRQAVPEKACSIYRDPVRG